MPASVADDAQASLVWCGEAMIVYQWPSHRIAAFERRRAAIHEAGHFVVAQWRGVGIDAFIFPTRIIDPITSTWARKMISLKASAETGRLIGVAGAVAEHCWSFRGWSADCLELWFWEDVDKVHGIHELSIRLARLRPRHSPIGFGHRVFF
jgi:hypothetical protein